MKNKINNLKKRNKGFTIVELLVVITIIGVLSSFVSVGYFGYIKKSKESVALAEAKEIYQAIEIALANDALEGYETVEDVGRNKSPELINLLETKCGISIQDDAEITILDGVLTYKSRGVTVEYNYE